MAPGDAGHVCRSRFARATPSRDIVVRRRQGVRALDSASFLRFLREHRSRRARSEHCSSVLRSRSTSAGALSGEGLLERMRRLTAVPVSAEERTRSGSICSSCNPRWWISARRLSDRHGVYLLSNVGDLHWQHLCGNTGCTASVTVRSLVRGRNHQARRGIYAEAERSFSLEPAATVFVDDRVAISRPRGPRLARHRAQSYEQTTPRSIGSAWRLEV